MASFGVRLKEEREQRGVTLEEISQSTKIGTRLLQALEEEHFDQLPGGIFNKGFIRAYARFLGLDEEQAIADYLVASGSLPTEKDKKADGSSETSSFEIEAERSESRLPWGTFAVLLLLAALGFALWGFYSRDTSKSAGRTSASNRMPATAPAPDASRPSGPAVTPASTAPTDVRSEIKAEPVPVTKPVSAPAATPAALVQDPLTTVPKALSLRITLHADSWLSITSDGHLVLQGSSFSAPTQKTIHAAREIVVKAGNAGALDLEFNGKTLPSQGADGEVKTLIFDANGLRPPLAPSPAPVQQQP